MDQQDQTARLRFESFELDLRARELYKNGRVIKLQDQPVKLLALLASRAGQLVTRPEIERALWAEDEFVEFEHAINTAVRKIRDALGDDPEKPRFIETLPRKGYRFIAPVETVTASGQAPAVSQPDALPAAPENGKPALVPGPTQESQVPSNGTDRLAEPEFRLPRGAARALFLTTQLGYLAMYCAALYRAEDLELALVRVLRMGVEWTLPFVLASAMCGIAVRLYLLSSVGWNHPAAGEKFRRLFPALFLLDTLWALSPLLLTRRIGYGLALGSVAALAYLPFSQRTLIESLYRSRKGVETGTS